MSHPNRAFWEAVSLAGLLLFVLLASVLHLNNWCRRNDSDSDAAVDNDDKPDKKKKDKESKKDKDRRKAADEDGGDTSASAPSTASTVPDTPSTSSDTPSSEMSEREKPRDRDRDPKRGAAPEDEWEEGEERRLVPDGSGTPPPRKERRQRSLSFDVDGTPVTLAMPEGARDFQVDTEHHGSGQSTPVSGLTTPASPATVHHNRRSPGPDGDGGGATMGGGGSVGGAYPVGQALGSQRASGGNSESRTVDGAHQRPGNAYNAAISPPLRGPNDLTVFSAFPDDSYYDKLQQELERFLSGTKSGKTSSKVDPILGDKGAEAAKRRLSAELKEPTKAKAKTEPVPAGLSPITANAHHVRHVDEPEVIPASPEKVTMLSPVQPPEPLSAALPDKKSKQHKEKEKKRPPPLKLEDEAEEAEKAGKTKKKKVVAVQESSPEVISPDEAKKKKKAKEKEKEPASPENAKAKKSKKASEEVSDMEEDKKLKKKKEKAKVKVKDAEEESEDEEVKEAKKAKLAKKEKAKAKVEAAESKLEERLQALEEAKAEQEKAEKEAEKAKAKAKAKENEKGKGKTGKEKNEAKDELAERLKALEEAMAKKEEAEKEVVKKKEKVEKKKKKLKPAEEEGEEDEEEEEVAHKGTKKAAGKKKGKSIDKEGADGQKKAKKGKTAQKVEADGEDDDDEVDIGDVGRKRRKDKVKAAATPADPPAQVQQQAPPAQQVPPLQAVPPVPIYQYTQQQQPPFQQQAPFYQQQNLPPASQQGQNPPAQAPNVPVTTYSDSGPSISGVKKRQQKALAQDDDDDVDQEVGQDIKSRKASQKGPKKEKDGVAVVGDAGEHSEEEGVMTDIRGKAKKEREKLKKELHQRKEQEQIKKGKKANKGQHLNSDSDAEGDVGEEEGVSAEELAAKRGKSRQGKSTGNSGLGAEAGALSVTQEEMQEKEEGEEEEVGVDFEELETRRGGRIMMGREKAREKKLASIETSISNGTPPKPGVEVLGDPGNKDIPVEEATGPDEVVVPVVKATKKPSTHQAQAPTSKTRIAEDTPVPVPIAGNKSSTTEESIPATPPPPANQTSKQGPAIPTESELGPPETTPPALDPPSYQSRAPQTEDVLQDARDDYGSIPDPFPKDYVAAWENPMEQKGKEKEDDWNKVQTPLLAEASSAPRRQRPEKDEGTQYISISKTSKTPDASTAPSLHKLQGKQGVSLADKSPEQVSFKQDQLESDGPRTPISAASYSGECTQRSL